MKQVIKQEGKTYKYLCTCQTWEQLQKELKQLKIKSYTLGYSIYEEVK